MVRRNGKLSCHGGFSLEFAAYAKRKRVKNRDPYQEVFIVKSQQMPIRTKKDNAGWPKHEKNPTERERRIAKKMKGKQFVDVIFKNSKNIIDWNLTKKTKKTYRKS